MPRAYDASNGQVQSNFSPLQSFPSSQNLPDVSGDLSEFIANVTEEALGGLNIGSLLSSLCGMVTGDTSGAVPTNDQMTATGQGLVNTGSSILVGETGGGGLSSVSSMLGCIGGSGGMGSVSSLLTGDSSSLSSGSGILGCLGGSGGIGGISSLMTGDSSALGSGTDFMNTAGDLLGGTNAMDAIGGGSSLLTGDSGSIGNVSGLLSCLGGSGGLGGISSLLTGDSSSIGSGAGILGCLGGSGGIGSVSSLMTGDPSALGSGADILSSASGLLDLGHGIVGSSGGFTDLFGGVSDWFGSAGFALGGTGSESTLDDLTGVFGGVLNQGSGLDSNNLFGQIDGGLMGFVPVSHIGQPTTPVNLISDPNFQQANSVGGSVFMQDLTKIFDGVAGAATVVADGTGPKDLLSNLIQVAPNQTIDCAAVAEWTGVTATGQPIILGLNYYHDKLGASLAAQPDIASLAASPGTTTWQLLDGASTVPAGVLSVRLRVTLAASATAGSVSFTNANLNKSGLLPASLASFSAGGTVDDALSAHAGDISSLFSGKLDFGDFSDLLGTFGGATSPAGVGGFLGNLLDINSPINGSNIVGGSIPTNAAPDFGVLFDSVSNLVGGFGGSGFGQSDVATSFGHQTAVVSGHAAAISQLSSQLAAIQASLAGTPTVTATDNFIRTNSTDLGTNWSLKYGTALGAGVYATPTGVATSWSPAGTAVNSVLCQWIGTNQNSATDEQEITIVLSSATSSPFAGGPASYIDVIGRMSSDKLNFIRLRFGGDGTVKVSRVIAGSETTILSQGCTAPGAAASLTLICGIPGVPRAFQGYMNGNLVISTSDVTSQIGTGFRNWGMGGQTGLNSFAFPVTQIPVPGVSNWSAVG